MLTKCWHFVTNNRLRLFEGLTLTIAAPFLLFPSRVVVGTLLALLGLILIETVPILFKWRPIQPLMPTSIPLTLFLLIIGISVIITADPNLTLDKATGVLLGVFLWRYLNRGIQTDKEWYLALAGFIFLGFGLISLGLLNADWVNKIEALTPIIDRLPNQIISVPGQPSSGIHPNQIAGTILFFFPLLWSIMLGQKWKKGSLYRWLILGFTLFGSAALLLTQSRASWLGGMAAIYILLGLWTLSLEANSKSRRSLSILVGLFTLVGIIGFFAIGPERFIGIWQDPAQETAVGSLGSLGFRQEVWRWTVVAIQDFPFTGIGLGSFRLVIRRLYPLNVTPSYEVAHAHNLYFHTAVDIGIPGLIIYLTIIGLVLNLCWQTVRHNPRTRPYALGLMSGLLAFHIYGFGDALALGSKTGITFWFLLGLITTLHKINQSPSKAGKL